MIPIMLLGRARVVSETSAAGSADPDLAAGRLRPHHVLILSLWCGLIAGPLEVGAIVLRKHTVDLNQLYWMSRHFVWLIPLTNLLIFLTIGLNFGLLALCGRRGRWLAVRLLCALTVLPPLWAAFPRIYGVAGVILALGIAARLVPALERRSSGFRRCVTISFPVLAMITPLLAGSVWAGDWLKERSEAARRLPPSGSPNVLLIVLDTVAAGHLSLHGYDRRTSPTLDGLARRGARFDRVQATSSWTLPSHAGFFTGRWPHELSAGWLTPLDARYPTLADYLGSRGYATAGFVANLFYCGADSGLGRGFTRYRDYIFPKLSAFKPAALVDRPVEGLRAIHQFLRERASFAFFPELISTFSAGTRKPAAVVNRELLDWLSSRRQQERPFFAFMNFIDVHYPYELPVGGVHRFGIKPRTKREIDLIENWRTENKSKHSAREIAFVRDSYDDGIADLDEQLGRLLDELERRGVLESTWLIITSDHGESFGEQPGIFVHGTSLYQPQLHVPLVIVPPSGGPRPTRPVISETVSLRDLPATVVDLLDLEAGAPFPGTSLTRLWDSSPSGGARADRPVSTTSPALSEVVPTDPLEPDPAKLLEDRRAWASLAEGDSIYIRIRQGELDREELFDLREDARQSRNLADDPARQSDLARMRATLNQMIAGPLTPQRFPL
jgi:arylsulfatase A-like enzyme